MSATYFGLVALGLLLLGVLSSLRLGGQCDELMTRWQREQLLKQRHRDNPRLRR